MSAEQDGTFSIDSWEEEAYSNLDEQPTLARASVKQSYQGAIDGTGEVEYTMIHSADKSATFIGIERVTATVKGKQGSFLLQHDGVFQLGVARSTFHVVRGSGRGDLMNISGQGSYEAESGGEASYRFEFTANDSC